MSLSSLVSSITHTLGRGVFPQQMSVILDLPLRKLILSPQKLVSRLDLNPASRVLEVGAGSGFHSVEVARNLTDGWLVLLDLQPEMLKKSQKKIQAKGLLNVGYTTADAGKMSLKEESFDAVFLVTVLGEISNREAFLKEAYRVLRRDGILSVSEHFPDPDFKSFTKVRQLVETQGFKFVKHYGRSWNYTANFRKST